MSSTTPIEKLDRNFAAVESTADTVWYDARDLGVEGRGFDDVESWYDRLPARAREVVRDSVWGLSRHSTGMLVRFVARTPSIFARWTLRKGYPLAMPHMPATGVSGLDLYARLDGKWRHAGTGRPAADQPTSVQLAAGLEPVTRAFMVYLPLYNGVESVHIGVPPEATLAKAPARPAGRDKPIVFYGTSVTQGGCASRPGMAYPAILGRALEQPTLNLGFSGNGKLEIEVGRFITEIDAALYVIDCLGNCTTEQIAERTEPLVKLLRQARPDVPILLLSNIPYTNRVLSSARMTTFQEHNDALKAAYDRLVAAGVPNIHHYAGEDLLGDDGEATVDGTHATDLGFLRMADVLAPVLRPLLA